MPRGRAEQKKREEEEEEKEEEVMLSGWKRDSKGLSNSLSLSLPVYGII